MSRRKTIHYAGAWLGDEASYLKVEEFFRYLSETPRSELQAWQDEQEEPGTPHYLLQIQDDIAILNIDGPMISGSTGEVGASWGVYGYNDIRNAAIAAANDPSIKGLVVWFGTPGGSARGVAEVADTFKEVDQIKPVYGYAGEAALSAGMWLASATRKIGVGKMGEMGSVGVIAIVAEYTKMFEEWGIKHHVFRSAPKKALGTPYEKMTKLTEEEIQKDLMRTHEFFVDAISENMGLPREFVSKEIATGEVWVGEEALNKGLAHVVQTFDQYFVAIARDIGNNTSNLSGGSQPPGNGRATMASKTVISPALSADSAASQQPEQQPAAVSAPPQAGPGAGPSQAPEGASDPAVSEGTANTEDPDVTVTVLDKLIARSEELAAANLTIAELRADLVQAKRDLESETAKLAVLEASHPALRKIVCEATQRAQISVGQPPQAGLEGIPDSALIQTYHQAVQEVNRRFPSGQVSDSPPLDESGSSGAASGDWVRQTVLEVVNSFNKLP